MSKEHRGEVGRKRDMAQDKVPQFVGEDVHQLDLYDILGVSIMVGCIVVVFGGTQTWKLSLVGVSFVVKVTRSVLPFYAGYGRRIASVVEKIGTKTSS